MQVCHIYLRCSYNDMIRAFLSGSCGGRIENFTENSKFQVEEVFSDRIGKWSELGIQIDFRDVRSGAV